MDPRSRATLLAEGLSDQALARAVRDGEMARIRRGAYVPATEWTGERIAGRQVALARAAAEAAAIPPVFSHLTAAAIHGLPLFDCRDPRTHVMSANRGRRTASAAVVRHRDRWDEDPVAVGGFLVTSLARTVFDVARTAAGTTAIGCADAALRQAARIPGTRDLDLDAAGSLRDDILALIAEHPGVHGLPRARLVAGFADPRAESVGESVSRLHLHDLGYRRVEIQRRVELPGGRTAYVDFDVDGVLCEFDGMEKYLDRTMRNGRTPAEVVSDEKRREDGIRWAADARMIRWTMREIASRDRFGAFLRSHGLSPR